MKVGATFAYDNDDWDRYDTDDFSSPPRVRDSVRVSANKHLASLVEPLGFDSLWAVEHHGSAHHMTGNAMQLLSYFAGRTERIDFGTCLVVLPWHHPLRVAEEVSMLDNLLENRTITLGFGRGGAPREFKYFGIDQGESRERFKEGVDILRLAFNEERFSYDGAFYKIEGAIMRPRPRSADLGRDMYCGVVSTTSLEASAALGMGLLFTAVKTWEECAADWRRHNEVRAEHGHAPLSPILVLPTYCAPTEEEAKSALKYLHHYRTYAGSRHYGYDKPEQFRGIKGYEQYADMASSSSVGATDLDAAQNYMDASLVGTPDQLVEKLQWLADHMSVDQIVAFPNLGVMPPDIAERSMRLFSQEVLPVAQSIQAAPLEVPA